MTTSNSRPLDLWMVINCTPHSLLVADGRPIAARLSLDTQGFALSHHASAVKSFADEDEIKTVYYPEMERLVKQITGAPRVLVFDHTLRDNSPDGRAAPWSSGHRAFRRR